VWHALRAAVGVSPLVDLDVALEQTGATIPAQIRAALPALVAAVEAGDPNPFMPRPDISTIG